MLAGCGRLAQQQQLLAELEALVEARMANAEALLDSEWLQWSASRALPQALLLAQTKPLALAQILPLPLPLSLPLIRSANLLRTAGAHPPAEEVAALPLTLTRTLTLTLTPTRRWRRCPSPSPSP